MNNLVVTRGKEIIICLLIIILMLIILLLRPTPLKNSIDPRISANLNNFIDLLLDPKENVHAVILAAPDKGGNLVILNKFLKPIEPCFESKEKLKPGDQVIIEPECSEENVMRGEDQIIALTSGKRILSENKPYATKIEVEGKSTQSTAGSMIRNGKTSFLWITEFDKKQRKGCINIDGTVGPPCY
jgi:hypothetical protein